MTFIRRHSYDEVRLSFVSVAMAKIFLRQLFDEEFPRSHQACNDVPLFPPAGAQGEALGMFLLALKWYERYYGYEELHTLSTLRCLEGLDDEDASRQCDACTI